MKIHIGTSGWHYKHWLAGVFYPPGTKGAAMFDYYARHFDTVEVNMTFYRLPKAPVVQRWVLETPPGFLFAVKVSRYVTHVKRLADTHEHLPLLLDRLAPLLRSPKVGPFLWQLPPTFQCDLGRLEAALEQTRGDPYRHAFEFRHPSWFDETVYRLLAEAGAALVVGDDPRRPFIERRIVGEWTYVRLHRGSRGRAGNYSDAELATWKRRIAAWRSRADVFAYFNNDWQAFAPRNAIKLL